MSDGDSEEDDSKALRRWLALRARRRLVCALACGRRTAGQASCRPDARLGLAGWPDTQPGRGRAASADRGDEARRDDCRDALTMAELGRRYIANLERQSRKKATTTAVESILRVWLEPFFAERDLRRITAQDVQDLMTMMEKGERPGPRAKGDRRYGRPVGAKSVRNYIGYLSALLGFAERKGWLPVNVARHVELPGKPRARRSGSLSQVRCVRWLTQLSMALTARSTARCISRLR
jgi:hypothetical protein